MRRIWRCKQVRGLDPSSLSVPATAGGPRHEAPSRPYERRTSTISPPRRLGLLCGQLLAVLASLASDEAAAAWAKQVLEGVGDHRHERMSDPGRS
jgi:hypothetical protein